MVRFGLCACVCVGGGGGRGYFPSYSVQDCSLSRKASPLVVGVGELSPHHPWRESYCSYVSESRVTLFFRKRNTVGYFNVLYTCFTVNFTTYTLRERRVNFHA